MTKHWRTALLALALTTALTARADDGGAAPQPDPDPWEHFNRKMFAFNDSLDSHAVKPVAKAYNRAVPSFVRTGVANFFSNLSEPLTVVNQLFQGNVRNALNDTGRFVLNTTVGVLGFFDVASTAQMPHHKEDFGETLGVWGVGPGPYLVVPFMGPSTVRDISGSGVDYFDSPVGYNYSFETHVILYAAQGLSNRAAILPMEGVIQGDRYLFIRDAYLQHRQFNINGGKIEQDPFLEDSGDDSDSAPAAPSPQGEAAPEAVSGSASTAAPATAPAGADATVAPPAPVAPPAGQAPATELPPAGGTATPASGKPTADPTP